MKIKFISIALATTLLLPSCATIIQGSKQKIAITTQPIDVTVLVDGELLLKGQTIVKLKRKKTHTIIVKKDGYETQIINIDKDIQAGYIVVDALLALTGFGLIFIITDAITGAWNELDKNSVYIELKPIK